MPSSGERSAPCPCASGHSFGECCAPYLQGEREAPSAETLMRSRYSAYVLGDEPYLRRSWAPSTRPEQLALEHSPRWCALQIVRCEDGQAGDEHGRVEFIARYLDGERVGQLHERSRFVRHEGRWVYLDGEIIPGPAEVKCGRNEPCPCGSGKKFKRCCAA